MFNENLYLRDDGVYYIKSSQAYIVWFVENTDNYLTSQQEKTIFHTNNREEAIKCFGILQRFTNLEMGKDDWVHIKDAHSFAVKAKDERGNVVFICYEQIDHKEVNTFIHLDGLKQYMEKNK